MDGVRSGFAQGLGGLVQAAVHTAGNVLKHGVEGVARFFRLPIIGAPKVAIPPIPPPFPQARVLSLSVALLYFVKLFVKCKDRSLLYSSLSL